MVFLTEGNMKKQLYRVKQLADQKFAGAERTEMLNDDLVNKEKRVDILRQVCLTTCKQTKNCIQGQGTDGASLEKRTKNLPVFILGSKMQESGATLWESSILGQVLGLCGTLQCELANSELNYEVEVERLVLAKYVEILEMDIPNINKLRKQLTKLTLDYDSAKSRYHQIVRQSAQTPTTKIDGLKQEYDDAKQKVESCKDTLATELYAVLAKETDLARCLYQLMTSQADYHRRCLEILEKSIPNISSAIQESHGKPAYGVLLNEHLEAANSKIAVPIEKSIYCLMQYGIEEEGILRIAGSSSKVKKLKNSFDVGVVDMNDYDPPAIAGAMKQYLRELPEPLMTFQLYEQWMDIARCPDRESKLEAIKRVLPNLPKANYDNLRYLIKFLAKVASMQDVNKMSSQNIAIVIAINLIWSPDEEQLGMNMGLASTRSAIVDLLISHADELFPGDEDFGLSEVIEPPVAQAELLAPRATCDIDDDNEFETVETNQNHTSDFMSDVKRALINKIPVNNESPKEATSPKQIRRYKKPAPPVPPPPKDPVEKTTGENIKSQIVSDEKPLIPFKPRHTRTASGISLDFNRPSSSPYASDVEGTLNSSSSKELSITNDGDFEVSEPPVLRSNFRSSLPIGIKCEDSELKTSSFRSVAFAATVAKDRSKSDCEPSMGVIVAKEFHVGKTAEVASSEINNEQAAVEDSLLNGMKHSKNGSVINPPERPPRPQPLPAPGGEPQAVDNGVLSPSSQNELKTPLLTNEIKIKNSSRNAYVNLPPNLEVLKGQEQEPEERNRQLVLKSSDNSQEDSVPPERPKKFDNSKVIPPMRPEKSERLRAMIGSKDISTSILKFRGNEESVKYIGKEKPSRPPPCSSIIVEREKSSSPSSAGAVKPERIYPVLTDLELKGLEEIDQNSVPKSVVSPTSVVTADSPVAPKRQPRPQPQPRTNFPVPKKRSVSGIGNPEHTHL